MSDPRRIVIVDDHPLLAQGLRVELERAGSLVELIIPGAEVAADDAADELVAAITARGPDCVVVDLGLPIPGGGSSLIGPLVSSGVRVVVLTGETQRWLLAGSAEAGAEVVLDKSESLDGIVDVIDRIARGQSVRTVQRLELLDEYRRLSAERRQRRAMFGALTPREEEVLVGLMAGQRVQELAERDYVSVKTVRTQVSSLLRKLGARSQLAAVAMAHAACWSPDRDRC